MNIETVQTTCGVIAVISGETQVITDPQSALDLIMTVSYAYGTKRIAIAKEAIVEGFFVLSTGLAGEVLQKMINYGVKCAIYGDYSHYTSKPLKDFIYESNHGHDIFFSASRDEAVTRLCSIS